MAHCEALTRIYSNTIKSLIVGRCEARFQHTELSFFPKLTENNFTNNSPEPPGEPRSNHLKFPESGPVFIFLV
ncbi:unnamed protein product [Tenebrio molitor]|nr:unnamed protein product [Tenebrio molitor]